MFSTALVLSAGSAFAGYDFDFLSPVTYPGFTNVKPNETLTVQVCASKKWLDMHVSAGALWPGPPYKVNFDWTAQKWNWAKGALPVTTLLVVPMGDRYCSAPLKIKHADFPAHEQWRIRATVQLDKGASTGFIERFIAVLPPTMRVAPAGNVKAIPGGPVIAPPGNAGAGQGDAQHSSQLPAVQRPQIPPGAPGARPSDTRQP
jgi:hypothetical protein